MVKLETSVSDLGANTPTFYFNTIDECKEFLYVFKDHWCNVPWKDPVEISDDTPLDRYQREVLTVDPKKRAEDNLSWGFSLCKILGIEHTESQKNFAVALANATETGDFSNLPKDDDDFSSMSEDVLMSPFGKK